MWPRRLAVLAALLIVASPAAAPTLTFARDDYPSVPGARAIVAADFDRDGRIDLATANTGRNSVSVFRNTGSELTRAFEIAVGAGPFAMTTGDYNRDGIPDLAVANADGQSISVLFGTGTGAFTRTDIATPAQGPRGIVTADLNHDGRLDLVYTGYDSGVVQVLLGDGLGGFARGASYASGASHPQGIAAGDFDQDGRIDLAVACESVGLRVLYGTAAGGFAAKDVGGASPNVLAVADLDHDGRLDVAAASTATGQVTIYLGSSSGLVRAHTYVVGPSPRGIAVADVNGDGTPDVITANRTSSTVSVLLGDPAHPGAFLAARDFAAGTGSRAVAAADMDGNGSIDLATGNEHTGTISVLTNATRLEPAARNFALASQPVAGVLDTSILVPTSADRLVTADFDRDGSPDFVVTATPLPGPGRATIVLSHGGTVTLAGPAAPASFLVADFNGDGNPDLLTYGESSDHLLLLTYLGDGHGRFTAAPLTTGPGVGADDPRCAAGDMNRDGRMDLVCDDQNAAQGVFVYIGAGNGTFTLASRVSGGGGTPVLADFNRDGRLDVVSQCDVDCTPQVYFGDGAGGLTPGPPIEPPAQGRAIAAGDINGDGYPDLLFEISGNNGVNVMLGGPNGFRRVDESGLSVLERFEGFALADLNGDGHLDVVLNESRGSEYASVVLVFLGRGDGTFDGGQFTLVPGAIAVADVNHDGLPDIVGYSVNALHVLVNTRGAVNHPPVVPDYATSVTYPCFAVGAEASDPEQHALFVSWFDASGAQVDAGQGAFTFMRQCVDRPGVYRYRRTATDMRGSSASGSVTVTVGPGTELYMYAVPPPFTAASESETYRGNWLPVADPTAAGGFRAYNPNAGMPKTAQPDGVNYVQLGFSPDPSLTYKLWIRLKADGNSWSNDSVWVEMSDATDTAGNAVGPFAVNLEECSGCGESGWGWEDDGWGAVNRNGRLFQFPNGGFQTIRISTREDGVSIDQIVLSAQKYLTRRPGAAKNDGTILPRTSGWIGW